MSLNPYAKAVAGGLVAGLFAWLSARDGGLTSEEWTTILLAAVSGSGLVWLVPNAPERRPLATGGPVSRGKPYVVGTGGREEFIPLARGTVLPDDPPAGTPVA